MPTTERVQSLVKLVEAGDIPGAMQEFYDKNVRMQDNNNPVTVGKNANIERENEFVGAVAEVHENRALRVIVDGDDVAIHWLFEFTNKDGARLRLDQMALQKWSEDKIVDERFIFDSASVLQTS